MKLNKPKAVAGITIPDSKIANQATELLREHGTELLYNHSLRVFVFASLKGQQEKVAYQDEILYKCCISCPWTDVPLQQSGQTFRSGQCQCCT